MSSDKGKGVAAGTRRKTRTMAAAAPLKQKTLLDSFFVKNSSKEAPPVAEEAAVQADTQTPVQIIQDEPLESAVPIATPDDDPPKPELISVDDTLEPQPATALPPVESVPSNVNVDSMTAGIDFRQEKDVQTEHRRSPSIVVIDDDMSNIPVMDITVVQSSSYSFEHPPIQEGKTAEMPIVIESSPIKARPTSSRPLKAIHPFFGAKPKTSAPATSSCTSSLVTQQTLQLPLYPDNISQHIRGQQTSNTGHPPIFPTRISNLSKDTESFSYQFLRKSNILEESIQGPRYHISSTINGSVLSNIPDEHRTGHPAIARILDHSADKPIESRRPWAEKWRPTCAQEVLGNEKSALYLRNWLRALELQLEDSTTPADVNQQTDDAVKRKANTVKRGLKRARVVRAVDKKRKKSRIDSDEEDDWIVQTDDESEEEHVTYEAMDDDFDELLLGPPASSSPQSCPDLPPMSLQDARKEKEPDLGQLHNTMLLVGPHGVGKTASVYACAEELGWDVFEVYPGIGRRNGANVDNLIGEVGKNHLVVQSRQPADGLKSFFRQKGQGGASEPRPSPEDLHSGYSPRKPSTSKSVTEPDESVKNVTKTVRQSLILLEEVDILYKEDSNFWPTVVRIIKECKRPVICTCNDISLLPLEELPLQSILYFEACPRAAAVSYLQGLCAAEGRLVERELISALYESHSPEQSLPRQDLRQMINSLQVLSTIANSIEHETSRPNLSGTINEQDGTFYKPSGSLQGKPPISMKNAEAFSFLDGLLHLESLYNDPTVIAEFAGYLQSEDDEAGHTILYDPHAQDVAPFGQYDRHADMLDTATGLAREMVAVDVNADALATQTLEEESKRVRDENVRVLQELCPTAIWTRRDKGLALDYIPLIRQMVAADDEQEMREMEKKRGGGRSTRNSARSGYSRMIGITEEGRRRLETSGLGR